MCPVGSIKFNLWNDRSKDLERSKVCEFEKIRIREIIKQLGQTTKICLNPASYLVAKFDQGWIWPEMKIWLDFGQRRISYPVQQLGKTTRYQACNLIMYLRQDAFSAAAKKRDECAQSLCGSNVKHKMSTTHQQHCLKFIKRMLSAIVRY